MLCNIHSIDVNHFLIDNKNSHVKVYKYIDNNLKYYTKLLSVDDLEEWRDKIARDNTWRPDMKEKWNPFDEKETEIHMNVCNECDISFLCYNKPEFCIRSQKKYLGKTPVNPKHYQAYMAKVSDGTIKDYEFQTLQWLESIQYKNRYQDQFTFISSVLLQADKYLSRLGGKDDDVQEIMKAIWYLKFAAAYIKNNGPIRVVDIPQILGDEV
jgi:hypothetical protein